MQISKSSSNGSTKNGSRNGTSRDGSQTLARGIKAFLMVVESRNGLSVVEVAESLGVHRSIAYRLLQTLADSGLITRAIDGTYLPGARLAALSKVYLPTLREAAAPVMNKLADEMRATILLFVEQDGEAVAIAMAEPTTAQTHISFKPGMRTVLDRGANGHSLMAAKPARADDKPQVIEARERGYAFSHGEVNPGAYGISAWIKSDLPPQATISLITYSSETAELAGAKVREAADAISEAIRH